MLTYNNDEQFKSQFVDIITQHRKDDMIKQGTYGEQKKHWKGCAIACSLRSLDILQGKEQRILGLKYQSHERFEKEGLWPEWLARLEDTIFEGLSEEESLQWPEEFANAIPVGVDITPVNWKLTIYLFKENMKRLSNLNISDNLKKEVLRLIRPVLKLHSDAIKTGIWDVSAAALVESSLWSEESFMIKSVTRTTIELAAMSTKPNTWALSHLIMESATTRLAAKVETANNFSRYAKYLLKLLKEQT